MAGGWFTSRGRKNANGKKFNIRFFRFETLRIATDNFSTLLGHGGYGSVYKGVLRDDDGRTVAIKKFTKPYKGFLEMVEVMSHLRHINLIQVIGCCTDNGHQLLVCEFADNGSVWELLYSEKAPAFDWETRASVCLGTARGLSYLHHDITPGIIHRDIKPSNIVLDANFVPKIADFDLVHFVDKCVYAEAEKETVEITELGVEYWSPYHTSYAKGTLGYLDPYFFINGKLTEMVDVYSFGLVMLEVITGRRPVDLAQRVREDRVLLDWVARVKKNGAVLKIVDPKLTDFPKEVVERFINVALLCTQTSPEQRPTMFEVVYMLYGRHKSDEEISEIAARAIADRPSVCITPVDDAVDEIARSHSDSFIVPSRSGVSESKENESCDLVTTYFERSMEKITRYHVATRRLTQTKSTWINKSPGNRFKEAVYPPFLSGEFHRRPSHF